MALDFLRQFYFPENVLQLFQKKIIVTPLVTLLDGWSFIHFLSGFLLGKILQNRKNVVIALVAFEVFEFFLVERNLAQTEVYLEQILDIAYGYLGYLLSKRR